MDGAKLMADVVVFTKYAKYLPLLNRRETWEEMIDRNISMHIDKYPNLRVKILEIFNDFVKTRKVLPSMRAIENSSDINTTEGWKKVGDIRVGDKLYCSDGNPTEVLEVFPFKDIPLYDVTLTDGTVIRACEEHLWIVHTSDDRKEGKPYRVVDTKFIQNHLHQGNRTNISIPVTEPVNYPEEDLPLDGYILGNWLADGYSSGHQLSADLQDREFIMNIYEENGFRTKPSNSSNVWTSSVKGLHCVLDKMGLINNKHIPAQYLRGSKAQRLALVQGLMDADGCIDTTGRATFTNTNLSILDGLKELITSLGIKYTLSKVKKREAHHLQRYTISFFTSLPVVRLPRKVSRLRSRVNVRNKYRKVLSVEEVQKGDATCFSVDSKDNSFLIGENMIVTHNCLQFSGPAVTQSNARVFNCSYIAMDDIKSFSEAFYLLLVGTGVGYSVQQRHIGKLPTILKRKQSHHLHVIEDSIEGWADAVAALISSYTRGSKRITFDFTKIRPKGSRLVTSGGVAPGSSGLKIALTHLDEILTQAEGRQLTSLEVHDMMCHIADAVVSGGIRRSSMISLFDKDDKDMATCKSGDWWEDNPQRGRANNSVVLLRSDLTKKEFRDILDATEASFAGEPGIFLTNDLDMGTNPCGEVSLENKQVCNLVEVNFSDVTSQEDLEERVSAAAFIATLQAGYTDFPYLSKEWKETTDRGALIGVSGTGIASRAIDSLDMEKAARVVEETNRQVAHAIGINPADRQTVIKPAGKTSIIFNTSSGIHAYHSPYYVRTVRVSKDEELYKEFKKHNPKFIEDDLQDANGAVMSFPIKAPEGALCRNDETAIEMLKRIQELNRTWIQSGHKKGETTNNISATVSVKPEEWEQVKDWMWTNRADYTGISLLPYDGGSYRQAPFQEITKEDYEVMIKDFKEFDLSKIKEYNDNTKQSQEVACGGGSCDII